MRTTVRVRWQPVLERAAEIVREHLARWGEVMDLRDLFYRLVEHVPPLIPNTLNYYKRLSKLTAAARREGWFPDLRDDTRQIHEPFTFSGPGEAVGWIVAEYRRDRSEFFDLGIYVAAEKRGLASLINSWVEDRGIPVLEAGGYVSQSYLDNDVLQHVTQHDRPAVLLYVGDLDGDGEDIQRDFIERTGCWAEVRHVALSMDQVTEFDLPPKFGKDSSSRASKHIEKYGWNVQVEVQALPTEELHRLIMEAIDEFWDEDAYQKSLTQEEADRAELRTALSRWVDE